MRQDFVQLGKWGRDLRERMLNGAAGHDLLSIIKHQ
jgi:hypothetical protein